MNYEELIENIGADAALLNTVGYRIDGEDFFNDDIFNELADELKDEFNGIAKAEKQEATKKYNDSYKTSDKGKEADARRNEKKKLLRAEAKALKMLQKTKTKESVL